MLQLPVGGGRQTTSRQLSRLQTCQRKTAKKEGTKKIQTYHAEGVLLKPHHTRCLLRGGPPRQRRTTAAKPGNPSSGEFSTHTGIKYIPAPAFQQETGQSVQAPNTYNQPLDNMLKVVTVVQQIMTEFNGAGSEEDKIVAITKIVLNLMKQNGH
jgi:hypothetical protein